jgi:hypothetical protein
MFKHIVSPVAALCLPFTLGSCALIFQGTSDEVGFTSNQSGASVHVDGETHSLPATLEISKKTTSATFSHPKYQSRRIEWKRDFQQSFFLLDFLFTPGYGLVGWITDGTTGAWYAQPRVINYDFQTGQSNAPLVQPKVQGSTNDKPRRHH